MEPNLLRVTAALLLAALAGCASAPIRDTAGVIAVRPLDVQQQPVRADGTEVLWGGRIVAFEQRTDHAEIEVVAYPLARDQSPLTEAPSEGRFLLVIPGYAEPLDHAVGRHLSVLPAACQPASCQPSRSHPHPGDHANRADRVA